MKKFIYILIGLLFVGGVVFLIVTPARVKTGKLDSFTQCVADSGTKLYGAFWCRHCQAQKVRFGNSARLLPYIECSTPDGQGQTQVCKDAGITTYPTWQFPNATTTVVGEIELSEIASSTGCSLPN
jgi:hypothetical protein